MEQRTAAAASPAEPQGGEDCPVCGSSVVIWNDLAESGERWACEACDARGVLRPADSEPPCEATPQPA